MRNEELRNEMAMRNEMEARKAKRIAAKKAAKRRANNIKLAAAAFSLATLMGIGTIAFAANYAKTVKVQAATIAATEKVVEKDTEKKSEAVTVVTTEKKVEVTTETAKAAEKAGQTIKKINKTMYVAAKSGVNIRANASTDAKKVASAAYGKKITVIGEVFEGETSTGWYVVKLSNGNDGFVFGKNLTAKEIKIEAKTTEKAEAKTTEKNAEVVESKTTESAEVKTVEKADTKTTEAAASESTTETVYKYIVTPRVDVKLVNVDNADDITWATLNKSGYYFNKYSMRFEKTSDTTFVDRNGVEYTLVQTVYGK